MINSIPYDFSYSTLGFGLQIWSDLARILRLGTRSGMSFLPFSSEFLEPAKTFKYYVLAIVIIFILLTCAGLLLVWNYIVCKHAKFNPQKRNHFMNLSPKQKCFALLIGSVMLIFLSYSVVSSRSISNSLSGFKDSLNDMFYKFHTLSSEVVDDLVDAFAKVDELIYSVSKASLRHVNAEALPKTEIMMVLDEVAKLVTQIQRNSERLLDVGGDIAISRSSSIHQINEIITRILSLSVVINGWTGSIRLNSNVRYKLNSAIPTSPLINMANQLSLSLNTISNIGDQINALKTMQLSTTKDQAKELSSEIEKIDNERLMQIAGYSLNLMEGWRKAQNTMNLAFTSLRSILFENINEGNSKSIKFIQLFDGFDIFQSISVISVLMIFMFLFYMYLNDRFSNAFWPLIILVFISAVAFFSVALVVGDICSAVFDYSPPPITETLGNVDSQLVEQLITLRDHCSTNISLLKMVDNLGLIEPLELNILALSTATLDNIVPMLSFSSMIRFSPELNTSLAPINGLNDNLGETIDILNSFTSFNQTLVILDFNLYLIETEMTINDFTLLSGSISDPTILLNDFKNRIQIARRNLMTVFSQTAALSSSIDALEQNFALAGGLVRDSKSASQIILKDYEFVKKKVNDFSMYVIQNISRSNPINQLNHAVIEAQKQILQGLECYTIAQEIFIIQDQMCGKVLASLDSQYFLYFVIAFLIVPLHLTMYTLN